jgi:hypothetical protein
VAGGERDYASRATILLDALEDACALTRETVRREGLVGVLRRGHVDFFERSNETRTTLFACRTGLQMRAVRRSDLEVEADLDEAIVGEMWLTHPADLVAARVSAT